MNLKDFTEIYVYKFDPSYDQWRILKGDKYEGDCEDFALSVLYYVVCNESLLAFWYELIFGKAKIHYVSNDGGHAVLNWTVSISTIGRKTGCLKKTWKGWATSLILGCLHGSRWL